MSPRRRSFSAIQVLRTNSHAKPEGNFVGAVWLPDRVVVHFHGCRKVFGSERIVRALAVNESVGVKATKQLKQGVNNAGGLKAGRTTDAGDLGQWNVNRFKQARSSTNRLIIDRETTRALKIILQRSTYSYIRTRRMSSTPSLPKFVIWAPDYTDEGALERRLAVRPAHLENAKKLIYYTADVWDKEKTVILPIALATGLPPVPS
ncbi:hypothetical protein BDR06DRAFT_1056962 [Suillus hirtellus]|nr:hypothetical protein BDR06DRAFT_1056962 [Suillus hirtellus]